MSESAAINTRACKHYVVIDMQIKIDSRTRDRLRAYAGKGRTLDRAINDLLDESLQKSIDAGAISAGAEER